MPEFFLKGLRRKVPLCIICCIYLYTNITLFIYKEHKKGYKLRDLKSITILIKYDENNQ